MKLQDKEIVFCNAKFRFKNKIYYLKEIVYKHNKDYKYYRDRILKEYNIKESVFLYDIEIISRLGFENKSKRYTEAKKNDNNNRNNITGAYD